MGAYSELDMELRYGGNESQEGDNAFFEDGDGCETMEPDAAEDEGRQADAAPVGPVQAAGLSQTDAKAAGQGDPKPAADKAADEDAKRKAHEEAEAKRKAEWEARQAKRKAEEQKKLDELAAMDDNEVLAASAKRVSTDIERLTRRNLKECVAEYIQTLCLDNPAFARKVMHPGKSIIHCIWYINRMAREFVKQEMKDNDIKPENGIYGSDVPDDLCYQWAEDYYNDPDAKEDHVDEEKFVPQPYRGTFAATTKKSGKGKGKSGGKSDGPKKADSKDTKPAEQKKQDGTDGQMSLLGVA